MSEHQENRPGPRLREEVVRGRRLWVARDAADQIIAVGDSPETVQDALADEPVVIRRGHPGEHHE